MSSCSSITVVQIASFFHSTDVQICSHYAVNNDNPYRAIISIMIFPERHFPHRFLLGIIDLYPEYPQIPHCDKLLCQMRRQEIRHTVRTSNKETTRGNRRSLRECEMAQNNKIEGKFYLSKKILTYPAYIHVYLRAILFTSHISK